MLTLSRQVPEPRLNTRLLDRTGNATPSHTHRCNGSHYERDDDRDRYEVERGVEAPVAGSHTPARRRKRERPHCAPIKVKTR